MVCLVVTLSRAMALSSFLSSSSLIYMSYSSWRCGGTSRLWSGIHTHIYNSENPKCIVSYTKTKKAAAKDYFHYRLMCRLFS